MKRERRKDEMQDNRILHDTHQEGIKRVLQRKDEKERGYEPGKMYAKPKEKANWRRSEGSLTPRRA